MGHAIWKKNIEDRVQLLGSNVLNCCLKITMAKLRKIGLTMNYVSKNLAPPRAGPCSALHYPLPPSGKCTSGAYFYLTGHEWSLTC